MGSGNLLHRSISKYGIEQFYKQILFVFDSEEEMNQKEKELVTPEFCELNSNYNLCPGGKGGFGYINKNIITKEHWSKAGKIGGSIAGKISGKKNLIEYNKNRPIEKRGSGFLNKRHSEETKLKMSQANRFESKNSQFGSMWITNGTTNKKIKSIDIIPEGWYKGRKIK